MTAALLLARVAVRAALTRFIGRGRALSVRAPGGGVVGGSESPMISGLASTCRFPMEEGSTVGGEDVETVAVFSARSEVVVAAGEQLPSASLILSSCRRFLLARSLRFLPVC